MGVEAAESEQTPEERRRRRLIKLAGHVTLAILVYGLLCLSARMLHRRVLYQPPKAEPAPVPEGATLITTNAADGVAVNAFDFPTPPAFKGARTIVHFHGNAETAEENATLARMLQKRGFGVVLVEYRGYGRSRGAAPNEEGLYADAAAVLDTLAARGVGPDHVVLWGQALGAGVAAEMARRNRGVRLILVAPFTSTVDLARRAVPILPVSWVMVDRFDTFSKAPEIKTATLVVHGDIDDVVPIELGERVANALPQATFFKAAEGRHDNLYKNSIAFQRLTQYAAN
jgi:pimeloyl-ACP methyl ester carboxylesterase